MNFAGFDAFPHCKVDYSSGKLIVLRTPTLKQYIFRKFDETIASEYFDIVQFKIVIAEIFKGCIFTEVSLEIVIE